MRETHEPALETPWLEPAFDPAWDAWQELDYFRDHIPFGMGGIIPGPIYPDAFRQFFDERGVPRKYRRELKNLIILIDRKYRAYEIERAIQESKQSGKRGRH